MKSIIAFLAITGSVLSASVDLQPEWVNFKVTHEKTYDSSSEEEYRYGVFLENLKKIEEHNARYDAGLETYYKGVDQFADMTSEDFMAYLKHNFGPLPPKMNDSGPFYEPPVGETLPASVDYRTKNACNPARQQGNFCGSCYAFASAGALESHIFLKTGKLPVLSPQNLVDCTKGFGNFGCNGGWPQNSYDYIHVQGIETEADYPYTGKNQQCEFNIAKKAAGIQSSVMIKKTSETDLQSAVANVGPVPVVIDCSELGGYRGGIFEAKLPFKELNHVVIVDGYGVENGVEYWLLKNSWGPTWGENGYIRIKKGSNQIGIADNACYPVL